MGTLQTDVYGFNNRSRQPDGNFRCVCIYAVKAPNSGDGHIFLERQELVQNLI